jgi:hypothetical protein
MARLNSTLLFLTAASWLFNSENIRLNSQEFLGLLLFSSLAFWVMRGKLILRLKNLIFLYYWKFSFIVQVKILWSFDWVLAENGMEFFFKCGLLTFKRWLGQLKSCLRVSGGTLIIFAKLRDDGLIWTVDWLEDISFPDWLLGDSKQIL